MSFDSEKGNDAQQAGAQMSVDSAQVTVKGLCSFQTWEFYLNGKNIGTIKDRGQVTAAASSELKNVLTAKDAKGAYTQPYEFYVGRGMHLEIYFERGKFLSSRRIDKAGQHASTEGNKPKIGEWLYWAGLIGYCIAVFFLSRALSFLSLVLSFLPILVLAFKRYSTHRAMHDYLSENDPEGLAEIASEQYANRFWGPRELMFVNNASNDPEYLELRKKGKRIFWTQILLVFTSIVTYFYLRITF